MIKILQSWRIRAARVLRRRMVFQLFAVWAVLLGAHGILAQAVSTSTDLFLMPGSDFVRPGLAPRVNLNIGIGHSFGVLARNPLGNELTFAYTYENGGSHGFWHTDHGSHTEALGVMRNLPIAGAKPLGVYTWVQAGLTSLTGSGSVQNRFYTGEAVGGVWHLTGHQSIWLQETYNKIATVPWYTSTGAGYVWSW